ncbi:MULTISPECIES: restriction endonuclease [Methylobacterium]|uniref:Restriction endonuclease type IV Mrr domain-containing protein n=1 Tax=Methylobacterium thuringiense TaxID=1003091 RepID=A0ABQ4TU03_9HYPH|nr:MULTISPECIES: restriction endonuclease [Methylobacterium]TXN22054.1 restriction endonuclease [Methylobacterium sp. WL9]GJE57443.1 hypothetical protein EKPJFOCH_3958 [Methylobacterium thuringiense]
MFETATDGIRRWIVGLFAAAIEGTARPEDRHAAIQWLLRSRDILAGDLGWQDKLGALNAQLSARAAASAIASTVVEAVQSYRTSSLPWPMKIALPVTLAAIPLLGVQGAGIAAFGGAIGLPVLLLVFLGTAGITSVLEAVVTNPHSRTGVAIIVAGIVNSEATRRASAAFRQRMAEEAASPLAQPVPEDTAAIRATLLAMNPYDFERHVMSFFEKAGLEAVVTPKSNDYGMDGYARDGDRLIVVQCKRYASDHKVGRPALQQFKTVMADAAAFRGYVVTTSSFSIDAVAYAAEAPGMVLIGMDALLAWHAEDLDIG